MYICPEDLHNQERLTELVRGHQGLVLEGVCMNVLLFRVCVSVSEDNISCFLHQNNTDELEGNVT